MDDDSRASPPGTRRLPERVGPFRIVGLLGVGGMGVVYDAEQEAPRRRVALKVVRDSMLGDDDGVRRFAREAEVLARLQHPGIAQVYATGVADGPHGPQPYFAMERVIGEPLGRFAERLGRPARLDLFARICDAVHYAHQRGVIHRDLKPGNILVDADGQAKVLDFGVARLTDADVHGAAASMQGLTGTGDVVGTLLYMSPEQLGGDPLGVDSRSDVYALGIILYELLAGRHPHQPSNGKLISVAHAVLALDPPTLGTVDRELRGDLETIAAKALEKDPARRYASAAALAADVRHYLAHEPITARPASTAYQLRKLARRHRGVVLAGGVAVAALVVGTAASVWSAVRARASERVAVAQRQRAEGALDLAERRRAEATLAQTGAEQQRTMAEQQRAVADAERRRADSARARATQEAAKAVAVNDFLGQMLSSADPSVALGRELTVRDVLDSAARRLAGAGPLAAQPAVRAAALRTLADSYHSIGQFPASRAAAESAVAVLARVRDVPPRERVIALRALGGILEESGHIAEAGTRYAAALSLVRQARPVDRQLEAQMLSRLGMLAYYGNRVAVSDSLLDAAVLVARRAHRAGEPLLARILLTRGEAYTFTSRPALAIPVMREALASIRAAHGDMDLDVSTALRGLAYALTNGGAADEAEPLLRASLAIDRRLHGDVPHNATAQSLDRLGTVLRMRGNLAEAEPLLREALAMRIALLGARHSDVQLGRAQLGFVLADLGRFAAAESLYTQALEGRRALYGSDHGAVASSLLDLGRLAQRQGDFATAAQRLRESAETFDRFGDAAFAMQARLSLVQVELTVGRLNEAERTAAVVRTSLRANPTRGTIGVVRWLQNAANTAGAVGRVALADSLASDALAMQRRLAAAGSPAVVGAVLTVARLRARAGDTTRLAVLADEARTTLAKTPTGAAPAWQWIALGESLCAIGRDSASADALRRGLAATPPADSLSARRGREALARCGG